MAGFKSNQFITYHTEFLPIFIFKRIIPNISIDKNKKATFVLLLGDMQWKMCVCEWHRNRQFCKWSEACTLQYHSASFPLKCTRCLLFNKTSPSEIIVFVFSLRCGWHEKNSLMKLVGDLRQSWEGWVGSDSVSKRDRERREYS